MRIVYVQQHFKTPQMAGGSRPYETAKRLAAAGHEVHVVCGSQPALPATRGEPERMNGFLVHVVPVRYNSRMGFGRRIVSFLSFASRSALRVRSLRPDVVFASSTPLTVAIPAIAAKIGRPTRMVFEVRDLWPEVPIAMGILSNPILQRAARALEKAAYRNSEYVVALSPGMADGVARSGFPTSRIVVAPNASDIERFNVPDSEGRSLRSRDPWLGERPLVVYCGSIGRVNGLKYMVDLAHDMMRVNRDVRFLIVGEGPEKEQILAHARAIGVLGANFRIDDPVQKDDLPAILNAATFCSSFVIDVPELFANSANKFFDALAASRPMLINHPGWQAEILSATGAGLQLSRDTRLAADQLNQVLNDPRWLGEASAASRNLAEKEFDRNIIAKRVTSVIEAVGP